MVYFVTLFTALMLASVPIYVAVAGKLWPEVESAEKTFTAKVVAIYKKDPIYYAYIAGLLVLEWMIPRVGGDRHGAE